MSGLNEGGVCLVRTESQDSEALFQNVYASELRYAVAQAAALAYPGKRVEGSSQCCGLASTSDEQSSSLSLLNTSRSDELQESTGIGTLAVDQTTQYSFEASHAEYTNTNHDLNSLDRTNPPDQTDRPRGKEKMDSDTESPTQANAERERDYNNECRPTPRVTVDTAGCLTSSDNQRKASDKVQPPEEEDLGAVVIDPLTQDSSMFSPVTHENPSMIRGNWRDRTSSQQRADSQNIDAPETPTQRPANPFLQKQASVLRATQLFNAPSSAPKKYSPTSSRPSPAAYNTTFPPDTSPALPFTSPLMDRRALSSPSRLRDNSPGDEAIPESPTEDQPTRLPGSSPPRKLPRQDPLDVYVSVAESQERKRKLQQRIVDSDDDMAEDENDIRRARHREANRRRAKAAASLDKIRVDLPPRQIKIRSSKRAAGQQASSSPTNKEAEPFRRQITTARSTGKAASTSLSTLHIGTRTRRGSVELVSYDPEDVDMTDDLEMTEATVSTTHHGTHTRRGSVELGSNFRPQADVDMTDNPVSGEVPLHPSSLRETEHPSTQSSNMLPPQAPQPSLPRLLGRGASRDPSNENDAEACDPESLVAVPETDLPQGMSPISTNNHGAALPGASERTPTQPRTGPAPNTIPRGRPSTTPQQGGSGSDSEPLSDLASTPDLPSPSAATADPISPMDIYDLPTSSANEPPAPKTRKPHLRAINIKNPRATRRSSRLHSPQYDSTDELAKTPSQLAPGTTSFAASRTSVPPRSARPSEARGNVFDNMAFAISFRAREDGETDDEFEERCAIITQLAGMVSRAGGRILATGFNELLDPATLAVPSARNNTSTPDQTPIELCPESKTLGFTALLADGHSRKVKYMQALALGLPCLAYQWATACIDKNEVLDWTPYLLCAGESAILGGASFSRWLTPYTAHDARLADVIAQQKALLGDKRVLLVMKRQRGEDSKMSYILLARILGANLVRVHNARDARASLREGAFDWAYVDAQTASERDVFGEEESGEASKSRKKKRGSTGAAASAKGKGKSHGKAGGDNGGDAAQAKVPRVRCLSNELLIQSLIMGRMIDEEERAAHGL